MEKVLVTGATGFVGAALVRELVRRGISVRITVRKTSLTDNIQGLPVERVVADVNDNDAMRRACHGCTHVYHVAGVYRTWMRDYGMLHRVNVEGTRTVLSAAQEAGVQKVIYTSSIAALGMHGDGKPSDEQTLFNLHHLRLPYEESKFHGERVAWEFYRQGLPLVVVRPALVMGEGDIYPTPSGRLVLDVLRGKVPCYFDGGIDVVDVRDVALGHILAMERGVPGESYNLGNNGNFATLRDLTHMIAHTGGVRPPRVRVPVWCALLWAYSLTLIADYLTHREPVATPASIRILALKRRVDFSKAHRELGLPQTPLADIITRTVKWYRTAGYV
ncbi:MAG: SDR family oxidoreductase [Desulfobacterota bacterium]|nr:SDR family oxidoreductase [Thermodesulfobacteriota bacterium]